MIALGNPTDPVDDTVLHAPGGFAWWYVDVITPEGDGAVLIWSYGLPFLPGYADAARRGQPERPIQRPSVNLALYRRGREQIYLLQEYPESAYLGTDVQTIGGCRFERESKDGRYVLEATLDCPVPGSPNRMTGSFRLAGTARPAVDTDSAGPDATHLWTPLVAPASGSMTLNLGDDRVTRIAGRAYHDRNMGLVPLHELGIDRWMWGRFPFGDAEWVYYLLWPSNGMSPRCLGLVLHEDGTTTKAGNLSVQLEGERGSVFGVGRPARIRLMREDRLWLDVRHTRTVDVGPFYLRVQSKATLQNGEQALGWGELCEPDRVDVARFRPLVRMRVHRPGRRNSLWLPLFNGPRDSRIARLLRHVLVQRE